MTIGNESFKQVTSFSINTLLSIETIEIGDDCFKSTATDIRFNSFPELISLKIGRSSFYDGMNNQPINNVFQVHNNSKLLSIEIDEYSFSTFGSTFSISSLPLLQNLTIGSIENDSNNFMNVASFSISGINLYYDIYYIGLPNLETLIIGRGSFSGSTKFSITSIIQFI